MSAIVGLLGVPLSIALVLLLAATAVVLLVEWFSPRAPIEEARKGRGR